MEFQHKSVLLEECIEGAEHPPRGDLSGRHTGAGPGIRPKLHGA